MKNKYDYGVKRISHETGLSGVQSKHIAMGLKKQNIGFDVVDWKTIGEETKDFGDRHTTVWNKLGSMYGISKPETQTGIRNRIQRFESMQEEMPTDVRESGLQLEMCHAVHSARTRRSIAMDDRRVAINRFKTTNLPGVKKWMKNPNRYDIIGVDCFPPIKRRRR